MVYPFVMPQVVHAGPGAVSNLFAEVQKLNATKVLLITDEGILKAGLAHRVKEELETGSLNVDVYSDVEAEPSVENVEQAAEFIGKQGYDLLVGVGGGSAIDVTKAGAVLVKNNGRVKDYAGIEKIPAPGLPTVIIPTTAGTGAEVTMNAIFTFKEERVKKGLVSRYLMPKVAIVDPEMTLTVPPAVTAATGMDALVHAVESYTAPKATPLTEVYAEAAITKISASLRSAVANGDDIHARTEMSWGSFLAGVSLANAGVGAVHALAYPLGGQFHVPHGVANSVLFAPVMEFNIIGNLKKFARVAELMGENTQGKSLRQAALMTLTAIKELARDVGIPGSIKEVGVSEKDIDSLVQGTADQGRLLGNNPRKLTTKDIEEIYYKALREE